MPTYTPSPEQSSPSREPDRPGKTFAVDFQRSPQQPMSKSELRALLVDAMANTAKLEIQRTPNKPKRERVP
jgi:hypothetical protein